MGTLMKSCYIMFGILFISFMVIKEATAVRSKYSSV